MRINEDEDKKEIEEMVNDLLSHFSKYFVKKNIHPVCSVSVVITAYSHLVRILIGMEEDAGEIIHILEQQQKIIRLIDEQFEEVIANTR